MPAFDIVAFDELEASFVRPAGWRVAFAKGKLMKSLVIEERTEKIGTAAARFSVNPVSNLMRMRFRRVSDQVVEFDARFSATSNPRRVRSDAVRIGDYVGRDLLLRTVGSDGEVMRERRLYLAHDARDWLVIIRFEAPAARWSGLANLRGLMFDNIVLR